MRRREQDMLTDNCWFALHDRCYVPDWCECLCHMVDEDWLDGIQPADWEWEE